MPFLAGPGDEIECGMFGCWGDIRFYDGMLSWEQQERRGEKREGSIQPEIQAYRTRTRDFSNFLLEGFIHSSHSLREFLIFFEIWRVVGFRFSMFPRFPRYWDGIRYLLSGFLFSGISCS